MNQQEGNEQADHQTDTDTGQTQTWGANRERDNTLSVGPLNV